MSILTEGVWERYIKKPVEIEAVELDADLEIVTLEGVMTGHKGDFVVRGVMGEIYPVRRDIFFKTYEKVVQ